MNETANRSAAIAATASSSAKSRTRVKSIDEYLSLIPGDANVTVTIAAHGFAQGTNRRTYTAC